MLYALVGERDEAVGTFRPLAADAGDPAILPLTRDDVYIFFVRAGQTLAPRAHDGVEDFNGMDAIVVEARIALVKRRRAVGQGSAHLAVLIIGHELHHVRGAAQGG